MCKDVCAFLYLNLNEMNCVTVVDYRGMLIVDETTWRFFEVVGIWFAGTATFCAVLVSLYLSWQVRQPKLRVSSGSRLIVGDGEQIDIISVNIANVGNMPSTVISYGWSFGVFSKQHLIQLPDTQNYSPQLPVKIDCGESALLNVRVVCEGNDWLEQIAIMVKDKVKWYQPLWLVLWSFKVIVNTATSDTFIVRVERNLRGELGEKVKAIKSNFQKK